MVSEKYDLYTRGLKFGSQHKREAKKQADLNQQYSETTPLEKLDWDPDVNDELDLYIHCITVTLIDKINYDS